MVTPRTSFPKLGVKPADAWQWPAAPSAAAFAGEGIIWPQRCRFDLPRGQAAEGILLELDAAASTGVFQESPDSLARRVSLSLVTRLTLLQPMQLRNAAGAPAQDTDALKTQHCAVWLRGAARPVRSPTIGHVETAEGLFLFVPTGEQGAVQRVLIPRSAYDRWVFESNAPEPAPSYTHRISNPADLWRAIDSQARKPVIRLGQALIELGMITPAQLDRALEEGASTSPLGKRLVVAGVLAPDDLQTAFAYKMGVPWVDVARFEPQPEAIARLPRALAIQARAMPLLLDGRRLVLAVDRLARIEKLRAVPQLLGLSLVPALARKSEILAALASLTSSDVWASNDFGLPDYVSTDF